MYNEIEEKKPSDLPGVTAGRFLAFSLLGAWTARVLGPEEEAAGLSFSCRLKRPSLRHNRCEIPIWNIPPSFTPWGHKAPLISLQPAFLCFPLVRQGKRLVCMCVCVCVCVRPYLHHPYYLFLHSSKCHDIFLANVLLRAWFGECTCVFFRSFHARLLFSSFVRMHVSECVFVCVWETRSRCGAGNLELTRAGPARPRVSISETRFKGRWGKKGSEEKKGAEEKRPRGRKKGPVKAGQITR